MLQKDAVLVDASSAILLFKADLFGVLADSFRVVLADSVYNEMIQCGYPGESYFRSCSENRRFIIIEPFGRIGRETQVFLDKNSGLDPGERDTLALFAANLARFIIIDDAQAAKFCLKNAIPFINALLVPKVLKLSNYIDEKTCQDYVTRLQELGRYSAAVINFALHCHDSSLSFFIAK